MFESLSDRLSSSLKAISGKAKITEDNIRDTLRDVRMALLEADVALPVVKEFTDRVKDRAIGAEVAKSLTPGQSFLKVVQAELQTVLGGESEGLNLVHSRLRSLWWRVYRAQVRPPRWRSWRDI